MRFSDPLDEAAALSENITEAAVAAARANTKPEVHPDFDGETCVSCGNDIPPARLKLQKIRCVECQSRLEEEAKRRGQAQGTWVNPWLDKE